MLPRSQEIILNFYNTFEKANKYQYSDPEKYQAILDNLYKKEIARRYNLLANIGNDPEKIKKTLAYISRREAIVDWLVDWGWTYDPRNVSLGLPTDIPFIPWPIHIEFIEWFYDRYFRQKGGLIEKSRDMGATWLFCFIFIREWRWVTGFRAGIGSRVLSLVDDIDNPKAIFPKMRVIINSHPQWWLPMDWNHNKHDKRGNLKNPENGAVISGEGGDDIGRGDRTSVYLIDEKAYLEHPERANASLSRTTNCQMDLSTPFGMNEFGKKRFSGRVKVFTFFWKEDPRKSDEWYEVFKAEHDEVEVKQEVDIDYHASVENLFIPPQHVRAAVDFDLPETGIRSAALDVAAGGKNKSALAIRKGCRVCVRDYNFKNGVDLTYFCIDKCHDEFIDYLNYDPLGVGHSVHSTIERTEVPISFEFFPVGAGEKPSDLFYEEFGRFAKDIFANAVTEWWYRASVLFKNTYEHREHGVPHKPEEMISIENNNNLISQLSAPLKQYTASGKIKRESKEDMAKPTRGIKRLDDADAVVMSLIPKGIAFNRVWPSYSSSNFKPTRIKWKGLEPGYSQIFIVLVLDRAGGIYGNCFYWGRKTKVLRVYAELFHPNPVAELLGEDIRQSAMVPLKAGPNMPKISKIYCNDEMMIRGKSDWSYVLLKRAKIRIHSPTSYEENASVLLARSMIQKRQVIVDDKLRMTNMQYRNWRIVDNKPEIGYPYCRSLCIAVSELKASRELESDENKFLPPYSKKKEKIRKRLENQSYSAGAKAILGASSDGNGDSNEYDYLLK